MQETRQDCSEYYEKEKGPLLALFIRGRSVNTVGVQKSTAGDRFPGPPGILRQ